MVVTGQLESPDLDALIQQRIELGDKDPHELAAFLLNELGDDLLEIARPYMMDFISERARHELNARRRAGVASITEKGLARPDVMLQSLWVPDKETIVYKRIADMTAQDFDDRAVYLERLARGVMTHASWCRLCSEAIREAGVATAGKLGSLPPLPNDQP